MKLVQQLRKLLGAYVSFKITKKKEKNEETNNNILFLFNCKSPLFPLYKAIFHSFNTFIFLPLTAQKIPQLAFSNHFSFFITFLCLSFSLNKHHISFSLSRKSLSSFSFTFVSIFKLKTQKRQIDTRISI